MRHETRFTWRAAGASALLAAALAACGGSGGDAGGSPPPGGGGATGPAGVLWHNSLATDAVPASKLSVFGAAATRRIDTNKTAVPSRDGSRYLVFEYSTRFGVNTTQVWLKDTASGATLQTVDFSGYVRDLRPSPTDGQQVLVKWSSSATTNDDEQVVVDLARQVLVETIGGTDDAANWLPDGRYLVLQQNGAIFIGTAGASRSPAGRLTVAGRGPGGVWISPQGTQMLSTWLAPDTGGPIPKDLWMSQIDGSGLQRFTQSDKGDAPVWSPDGRFVAFVNQAERVCTGFECVDTTPACDLQLASSDSRNLTEIDNAATAVRVPDAQGRSVILGCSVLGWTGQAPS